jgi:hypothetical protein
MFSGCINECLRHRRVAQIENDILNDVSANEIISPLLQYLTEPTDLKHIHRILQHLPSCKNTERDDHIYGATRYIANSLGLLINDTNASSSIDTPMTAVEEKTNMACRYLLL